ncbi:MAG: hypothetical protein ACYCZZ_03730 [Minisyncoccota bacterium]
MNMFTPLLNFLRRKSQSLLAATVLLVACAGGVAHAQLNNDSIARTYVIPGAQPISGDLISLDRASQTLHLSSVAGDSTLFGVVVSDPVIVLRSSGANVPIVTSGEAIVNVTTLGGVILPGDFITTSSIAGKGQLASSTNDFVVGMALAAFPVATTTPVARQGAVVSGNIPVLLQIGPYPSPVHPVLSQASGTPVPSSASKSSFISASTFFRYLLAAIVAIGSVVVAFRNFGSSISDGIISVGRNPLARSSIQSMVVLNVFLTALVSVGGLFIGFAILFLPI